MDDALTRLARRDWLWIVGVGGLSLLLNVAVATLNGTPRPMVHDEFSYLLAADTFAHGRLTNPTHPLSIHFETIHVLQRPTYQSKFPPGQGLALAAGQVLTGAPIVGAWLASAAACAAVTWALRAALPLPWAVLGGSLAVLHPLVLRWSRNYWGGSVAMLGGAVLWGGLERVIRERRAGWALLVGAGASVLFMARPFEGLVLTLLALGRLAIWLLGCGSGCGALAVRTAWCLALGAAPGLLWLGYYQHRVTGHALTPPYLAYIEQYQVAPPFFWQRQRPAPQYPNEAMREFHVQSEPSNVRAYTTAAGVGLRLKEHLMGLSWRYTAVGALAPLLVGLVWAVRADPHVAVSAVVLFLFGVGLLATNWTYAHYAAPGFAVFLLLTAAGARSLWSRWWRGWPVARVLVVLAVVLEAAAFVAVARLEARRRPLWWTAERARVIEEVSRQAPRSLVIVHYAPGSDVHAEWVYNGADIDHAPIVWARALTPERDRALVDYFRDRRVWRLDVSAAGVALRAHAARAS